MKDRGLTSSNIKSEVVNDSDKDQNLDNLMATELLVGYQVKSRFDYNLLKGVFGKDLIKNLSKDKRKKMERMHTFDVFDAQRKLQLLSDVASFNSDGTI